MVLTPPRGGRTLTRVSLPPTAIPPATAGTTIPTTWPSYLEALLADRRVPASWHRWAMREVMGGLATPAQIAGFMVALRASDVTGPDLSGLVDVMLEHAVPVAVPGLAVDTCGTGGDNSGSVNISTMAAVVVAATGRTVVKHGNRAASSKAGSADVLEALGVVVDLPPELIAPCVQRAGIAFCFAQVFHPAMRFAGPIRKELGIRSVFNVMGPLANPARPGAQVVGVTDPVLAPVVAECLAGRGTAALIVRGEDAMDEITTLVPTRVWDARSRIVTESLIDTVDLGLPRPAPGALDGGDAAQNAEVARSVLQGAGPTPVADAVAVNAAAAMVAFDTADRTLTPDFPLLEALASRLAEAQRALATGAAAVTLDRWIAVSRELASAATA